MLRPLDAYDGWALKLRPPRVGDIGTIVDILKAPGHPTNYVVEASQPDGTTLWLGDFLYEELELVEPEPR